MSMDMLDFSNTWNSSKQMHVLFLCFNLMLIYDQYVT